ncbi:TfoX/Sxy family protein [Romboutsia sp.]|uniref:TfoX/Sxy family protein n=1 Tax=Romboutsia sp. TaxID=1965302 RepID=UPI003F40ADC4
MAPLYNLPNISKVIEGRLIEVDINTPQVLFQIGSKEAFSRIKEKDSTVCINMLYALEGAVEGIRWHYLSDNKKRELKEFYKTLQTEKFNC